MTDRTKAFIAQAVEGLVVFAFGQYVFSSFDFPMAWIGVGLMALGMFKVASLND